MLTCSEILKAIDGKLVGSDTSWSIKRVSIDSRSVKEGDLFIPIIGNQFDGHDYIKNAFDNGATAVLSQREIKTSNAKRVIYVNSTFNAIGELAKYYRTKFKIPFVAITGSVGKTSTKEMIASVLEKRYIILKTAGNFNNEIGLPLTIFNLTNEHNAAVIEMGMSGFGEISKLSNITKPDIAVITNIGISHIEKLKSKKNILKAKMEILDGLKPSGCIILNGDDSLLIGMKNLLKFRTVFYGINEGLDYQAYNIENNGERGTSFEVSIGSREYKVVVPVPGMHNVYNALAALAVGVENNIPVEKIIEGIREFKPEKMRMEIVEYNGVKIINDVYNASPNSVEAAIEVLCNIANKRRKIAILGDMLELGDYSQKAHYDIGKYISKSSVDYVIAYGTMSKEIIVGAIENGFNKDRAAYYDTITELECHLREIARENDIYLVKGSRGMKMEQVVNFLKTVLN